MSHYERPKIKTYKTGDVRRYAHLKRDGIMLTLDYREERTCKALTRHPDGAHDIAEQLDLPAVTHVPYANFRGVLFCELFAPGQPASQVKSLIASGTMTELEIECFAIPSMPAELSLETLKSVCKEHVKFIRFADFTVKEDDETDDEFVEACVQAWDVQKCPDSEGYVFKNGNLLDWCKWKPVKTCDLVVLDFKEGKGKYLGTLGALVLGLHDGTEICNCSGMDDETRDEISENEEKYLGTVVEVEYQRRDSGGGLRHPRFKCFRPDKSREECLIVE